jgi:hypothetical protein
LRGVYTHNDESAIPFERPAEFDGKRLEDVLIPRVCQGATDTSGLRGVNSPGAGEVRMCLRR